MRSLKQLAMLLLLALPCWADSTPFVYQNQGFSSVSLAGSPLILPTFGAHLGNSHLEFGATLGPTLNSAVIFTLSLDGITQSETVDVSCLSGCTVIDGFAIPNNIYHNMPATFTMTINGQSVTETFTEAAVVPEPDTLFLVGAGLLLYGLRRRWNR